MLTYVISITHYDLIILLFYVKQPINYFLSDEKCCTWLFAVIEPVRSRLFQLILISVQWISIMCIKLYLIANKTLLRYRKHINSPILKNETSISVHDFFRIVNMRQMILTLIIMNPTSLAHDAHGLGNRKDFKYQDSWTVKLLRHLTGNEFSLTAKSLQNRLV